jgi:hypothetical protein
MQQHNSTLQVGKLHRSHTWNQMNKSQEDELALCFPALQHPLRTALATVCMLMGARSTIWG